MLPHSGETGYYSVDGSILTSDKISCPAIAAIVSIRKIINQFIGCESSLMLIKSSMLAATPSTNFALHILLHNT
jgi:hypothetical protein